jgi:hypothetical protein
MGRARKYTDNEFREAVKSSVSISEVLRKLGLKKTGSQYTHFRRLAVRLGVDHSHFTGQAHRKGKLCPQKSLDEILIRDSDYDRGNLKKRLLASGLFENECSRCGLKDWMGEPLTMHLDHINGDCINNRIENLRMLCPNCHAQTPTYCRKHRR